MAQELCTQAQAFAILRGASQNRNLMLRDIATQIVTSVSGQSPQPSLPTTAEQRSSRAALAPGWEGAGGAALGMTWRKPPGARGQDVVLPWAPAKTRPGMESEPRIWSTVLRCAGCPCNMTLLPA
jgi:hypothetical protein